MIPKRAPSPDEPFWRTKRLTQMTRAEWESLCDGCGKCCLHKLQYEKPREIQYTNVACRLLDLETCRCKDYAHRQEKVPDCIQLQAKTVKRLKWLPSTCAYRLLANGEDLPWWHPLVSGDPSTVHSAGQSVKGRAIAERAADILDHHIVSWPK
jgi:uncharacterized cysteine cluster protein YcgN (CxxCxxCC family)